MSTSEALKDRRSSAVERLMRRRQELIETQAATLDFITKIDDTISSSLRRIGAVEPELLVSQLESSAQYFETMEP